MKILLSRIYKLDILEKKKQQGAWIQNEAQE